MLRTVQCAAEHLHHLFCAEVQQAVAGCFCCAPMSGCLLACRLLEVMRAQGLRPNGSVAFSLVKACAREDQDLARVYVEEFQANGIRRASLCSLQNACFGRPM